MPFIVENAVVIYKGIQTFHHIARGLRLSFRFALRLLRHNSLFNQISNYETFYSLTLHDIGHSNWL